MVPAKCVVTGGSGLVGRRLVEMLAEVAPKSKAAEGLEHLARLISRREPPPTQKTSLF